MTYFMTPKVTVTFVIASLWPQKVMGSLEVAVTYFMTPKVTVTFVVGLTSYMTPKGQGFIRCRRDLLYEPKGHGDLCGRFDLVYDPKGQVVAVTYFMAPKVNLTFDLDVDLRVNHLIWQVTIDVKATL